MLFEKRDFIGGQNSFGHRRYESVYLRPDLRVFFDLDRLVSKLQGYAPDAPV